MMCQNYLSCENLKNGNVSKGIYLNRKIGAR